jgi:hypothetical protein
MNETSMKGEFLAISSDERSHPLFVAAVNFVIYLLSIQEPG